MFAALLALLALLSPAATARGGLDDSVVYGVIPGRFGDHGADSVIARLDELVDLGVDVL